MMCDTLLDAFIKREYGWVFEQRLESKKPVALR
jgi:hypothetical protein